MSNNLDPDIFKTYIRFNCFVCDQSFNVELKNLPHKDSLSCPNCGQPMDNKAFQNIKDAAKLINEAIELLDKGNEYDKGWNFYLHWDKANPLPKKPDPYRIFYEKSLD
ncbi:hypothetical protein Calhy_0742 [Caldicellulosiruptor hydrothermalis 108]|uniref:Zinc ribbon domain-containing protein n=1 Tax=Caldicellulosiruptor hydrothermalis (strain DSM 18901 / VKM B-2411 / 108) TaxID=632292 RepID=E4QDR2_CALH1|nr:hypothetical protein [Caldicellulosiruptor hydrothermalis]ADQ06479.1 hypothetical protein Calhy_0742 [Caldicellulosiruptor hydrothermalis 108]